jgi:hypothetical protein
MTWWVGMFLVSGILMSGCLQPVAVKKDLPEGVQASVAAAAAAKKQTANPVTIVWDGDEIGVTAQNWVNCNDKQGGCKAVLSAIDGVGRNDSVGLSFHAEGKDWIGFGWNWVGWYPVDAGIDATQFKNCVFWMKVTTKVKAKKNDSGSASKALPNPGDITFTLVSGDGKGGGNPGGSVNPAEYTDNLLDGKWHEIVVPISEFVKRDKSGKFNPKQVWEFDVGQWSMVARNFDITIDDVGFDNRAVIDIISLPEQRNPAPLGDAQNVTVSVDLSAEGTPISPYVYGGNFTDPDVAKEAGVTIRRWGGNSTTTYDWRTGFHNKGADWFFENANSGGGPYPEKTAWVTFHEENVKAGIASYLTLPAAGWVSKDDKSAAFPLSVYPGQLQEASDRPGYGNGQWPAGQQPKEFDPTIALKKVTPEEQAELYNYCLKTAGIPTSANGGIKVIAIDNEPCLWESTHKEFGYKGLTYDDFLNLAITHATLLKKMDPTVLVAAPCLWGWTAYYMVSSDSRLGPTVGWDRNKMPGYSKNGIFLKWWLTELNKIEKKTGKKLVDILDIHFYPQANGVQLGQNNPGDGETRVQETRVLWDPTFVENSWMERNGSSDNPNPLFNDGSTQSTKKNLQILRMMKDWIKECNPGMKLAIGEYNWSGNLDVSGGVAQAELLGIFAREEIYSALLWTGPDKNTPQYFAWKIFRNPDGKFTAFGDRYLPSEVSAPDDVSVHAARAADGKVTFVLINKRAKKGARLTVKLSKAVPSQTVALYEYSSVNSKCIGLLPDMTVGGDSITINLPPMSVLRFDVKM